METKEYGLFSKKIFEKDRKDGNSQYSNINLNQMIHKCSNATPVQFHSKINNNKQFGHTVNESYQTKLWSQSTKGSPLKNTKCDNVYDDGEEEKYGIQQRWKKDKNCSNITSSTLSLHIAAYENSIEDLTENDGLSKKLSAVDLLSSKIQDSFEFPRQMGNNDLSTPQVMHFKASQKLLSPNQGALSPAQQSFHSSFKGIVMEKKDVSEKDAKRLKEAVGQLSKLVSNSICADCHQQRSLWASVNFGVFLCSRCAGMHRHLGVHVTQVRSINLDTWTPIQLLCVTLNGNMWTNSWLLSNKSPDYGRHILDDPSMSRFIQEKYESKKFGDNSGILLVTKSNFPYITVEKALEVYKLAMTLHRQQVDHCLIRPQLIAAAGFDYAVPTHNPGNRKLLLVMEDSKGGDQKHITQAHISGIPQGKKSTTPVIPSFKGSPQGHQQLGHTASASNIRVTNFVDIDDFALSDNIIGVSRDNNSADSFVKPVHAPAKSSSFGVFPTEGHSEPAWPTINASSGDNLNSFFKEPPRTIQSAASASEHGIFGSFTTSSDNKIFNNAPDSTSQNTFIPNFDLSLNEKPSNNGKQKSNIDNNDNGSSLFFENILGPSSSTPASNNEFANFGIPPMAATPFSYNTVSSSNGNSAKQKEGGDATQDKDFILSLYSSK